MINKKELINLVEEANNKAYSFGERNKINDKIIDIRINFLNEEQNKQLDEVERLAFHYFSYGVLHAPAELESKYFLAIDELELA